MKQNKKAISFSIYGDNPKYLIGLMKNLELCKYFYPDWIIFIYYDNTVPSEFIKEITNNFNIVTRDMSQMSIPGMFWRFLVHDEIGVDLFIIRDVDSRLGIREAIAVYDWINSNKNLHIMRDHPHHTFKILGGMWGLKVSKNFNMKKIIFNYLNNKVYNTDVRNIDQDFLRDVIYKTYYFSKKIHASFNAFELFCVKFPIDLINYNFVGEIFDENDNRAEQYKLLIND